jgi:uncharacterized protein YecE (DUF72 family)
MSEIRIGPAGWSYQDWNGRVYPDPPPANFDPLAYLARSFDTLEVNSTFYRPAPPRMSEAWARRTPEGFLFTVKAWEKFSHDREGFTEADARVFQEGLAPLLSAGKLGAILLQFPWFFKDGPEERDRIRRAAGALGDWAPVVLEVRHRSWLEAFDFFRELGISFCNIDQPRSSTAITGTRHVTGPVGYVRLHGRNARAWFSRQAGRDEKYDYLYSPAELAEWAEAVRSMEVERLFFIANNHFQGKAVVNALQLKRALGQDAEVPPTLAAAYPGAFGA